MAETDELEDSLFASLLTSKPKGKRRTTTTEPLKEKEDKSKLFDLSSDDLLDLLSDGEEPPKKSSNNKSSSTDIQPAAANDTIPSITTTTVPTAVSFTSPLPPSLSSSFTSTPPLTNTSTVSNTKSTLANTYTSIVSNTKSTLANTSTVSNTKSTLTNTYTSTVSNTKSTLTNTYTSIVSNTKSTLANTSTVSNTYTSTPPNIITSTNTTPTSTNITSATTNSSITSTTTANSTLTPTSTVPADFITGSSSTTEDSSLIQFGSYVPSSRGSRPRRGGPLDFPSPRSSKNSLIAKTDNKTVRFDTSLIDDDNNNNDDDMLLLPKKESTEELIKTPLSPEKEIIRKRESFDTFRTPPNNDLMAPPYKETIQEEPFKKEENLKQDEHLIKLIKSLLKEEMTKRDEVMFLKFTQLESALITEEKRLQEMVKNSMNKVSNSVSTLEQQIAHLEALLQETSQTIISTLSNEIKDKDTTINIENLKEILQSNLDQLSKDQTAVWDRHFKAITSQIDSLNQKFDERNTEKLNEQETSFEKDWQKMNQLLSKLESQICQKEKTLEQKQWMLSQSEAKVKAQLSAFEEEKQQSLQYLQEQKLLMEKSKEEFLKEQQDVLKRCYSNSLRLGPATSKHEIEINAEKEALTNAQLQLKKEQLQFEQEKQNFQLEQDKLKNLESDLSAKASQISEVAEIGRRMYVQGQKSLEEALELEQAAKKQFYMLKNYQMELQQKERQLVMEKVNNMRHWDEIKPQVEEREQTPSHPSLPHPSTANASTELYKLEVSESLQQLLQRIEKDDHMLLKEEEFLNVVKSPSKII